MATCIQSVQAFRKPYPPSLVTVDHFHTCVYGLYSLRVAVPPPVKWVFHQGEGRVRLHVD